MFFGKHQWLDVATYSGLAIQYEVKYVTVPIYSHNI